MYLVRMFDIQVALNAKFMVGDSSVCSCGCDDGFCYSRLFGDMAYSITLQGIS